MTTPDALPRAASRLDDSVAERIVHLAIRQVSQAEIARRTGVHRRTVRRVLTRTRAALRIDQAVEQDRAEAIAVYREVQRRAWEAIEEVAKKGRSPAMLLGEVRQAQARIDALLGTAPAGPDDPVLQLEQFRSVVLATIQAEAPELAPKLARRLLAAAEGEAS